MCRKIDYFFSETWWKSNEGNKNQEQSILFASNKIEAHIKYLYVTFLG